MIQGMTDTELAERLSFIAGYHDPETVRSELIRFTAQLRDGKEQLQRIWDYLEDMNHCALLESVFTDSKEKMEALAEYYEDGAELVDEILQREFPATNAGR